MAQQITYGEKFQGQVSGFPTNQKWTFGDGNEVKDVVNNNATETNTNAANIAQNTADISNKADKITATVVVESVADLPAPSGGWHTLADNTEYSIKSFSGVILGTNGIKFGDNSHIYSDVPEQGVFVYTGTGYAIDNNSNAVSISGAAIQATSGKFINFDGQLSTKNCICKDVFVFTDDLGIIKDAEVVFINNFLFEGFTDGFLFQGSNESISISIGRFRDYTNTALDFGSSTNLDSRFSLVTFAEGAVGSFAISGLTNSGNITNRALVDGCIFNGDGDALENITSCDLRWEFKGNVGKPEVFDSGAFLVAYVADGDETGTSITVGNGDAGNPIPVTATWTEEAVCRFTSTAAGVFTYIGLQDTAVFITAKFEAEPNSGSNIEYWFQFRKNGSTLNLPSRDLITADASNPGKVILQTFMQLSTNDYIEIVVENRDGTTNAQTNALNMIIG